MVGIIGLVTGGHPLASMAGTRILMQGGIAIDATVAVGAVLNVVKTHKSGAGATASSLFITARAVRSSR